MKSYIETTQKTPDVSSLTIGEHICDHNSREKVENSRSESNYYSRTSTPLFPILNSSAISSNKKDSVFTTTTRKQPDFYERLVQKRLKQLEELIAKNGSNQKVQEFMKQQPGTSYKSYVDEKITNTVSNKITSKESVITRNKNTKTAICEPTKSLEFGGEQSDDDGDNDFSSDVSLKEQSSQFISLPPDNMTEKRTDSKTRKRRYSERSIEEVQSENALEKKRMQNTNDIVAIKAINPVDKWIKRKINRTINIPIGEHICDHNSREKVEYSRSESNYHPRTSTPLFPILNSSATSLNKKDSVFTTATRKQPDFYERLVQKRLKQLEEVVAKNGSNQRVQEFLKPTKSLEFGGEQSDDDGDYDFSSDVSLKEQSPHFISLPPGNMTEKRTDSKTRKRRCSEKSNEEVQSENALEKKRMQNTNDIVAIKVINPVDKLIKRRINIPNIPQSSSRKVRYFSFSKFPRLRSINVFATFDNTLVTEKDFKVGIRTSTEAEYSDCTMPDGKAPHFPQQPVARQNDDGSLELECFVDANPTPQVKWYYDNKEVENTGRFSAGLTNKGSDSYSAVLTIKELADADAGAYRCAIVNPHGKGNANFNLKLTGFSSPTFVEKPQISSRDDGQVMVMEFRAKSILEPTFVWQKLVGGGAEEIIANSDRIKAVKKLEAGNVYYSALEIKEPTKDKDAGQFICTVKNESGKLTATFTVKFEVPEGAPSFTRKPQILQQTSFGGEPAICFDIGYSARLNPQVTWISPKSKKMKESSRIKFKTNDEGNGNFTAQLELTNYKAKDSGTYTCNIKNDAGEANVELTLNIEGPLDDYADDSEN